MLREGFRAMGTSMELLLDAPERPDARAALVAAREEIERLEGLLSRVPARLGAEQAQPPAPDAGRSRPRPGPLGGPDAAAAHRRALRSRPWVARSWRPGYDRSFEMLEDDPGPEGAPAPGGGVVVLDSAWGWAALGPGVDLDLGAIAKGDAADRACAILAGAGPCLVNAGGDIAVSGPREDGAWPVAVAVAEGELVLCVERGALATSGVDRRRWQRAGRTLHHAVEPRNGRSAATDLVRATAIAPTGAEADALATALLIAGAREAEHLADTWRVPAVLVDRAGGHRLAGGLR